VQELEAIVEKARNQNCDLRAVVVINPGNPTGTKAITCCFNQSVSIAMPFNCHNVAENSKSNLSVYRLLQDMFYQERTWKQSFDLPTNNDC